MKNGGPRVEARHDADSQIPLCVDLDGTLVRTDTLVEALLLLCRSQPRQLLALPLWLGQGLARFKERVATVVRVDPASLPYDPDLLDYLRNERDRGRRLLLVTASHERTARDVADHLELFDEVIATNGRQNLKGRRKRDELVRRFGDGGFDYAGDSAADLSVWPAARRARDR